MNFLVDAQLPRRLANRLREAGHDARHTLELPRRNRTTDAEIIEIATREQRVVVTKDADFVNTFFLAGQPFKLLLISAGNISNADLERLLIPQIPSIVSAFQTHDYIELTPSALVIHV
jgi:predicted nuclease of predicted toxin-antitoxin system